MSVIIFILCFFAVKGTNACRCLCHAERFVLSIAEESRSAAYDIALPELLP